MKLLDSLTSATSMFALLVLTLLFVQATVNAQVQVTTIGGEIYAGRVIDDNPAWIMLVSADSVTVTVPKSSVRMVEYGVDVSTPRRSDGSFWSFGAALGTPAIVNLIGGYNFSEWGIRLSGGIVPTTAAGLQFDLRRNVGYSGSLSHNIHIGVGSLVLDNDIPFAGYDWWDYIAIGYDLNWGGFYLAGDLSFGEGTYSSPQILAQIGYVHEFR